ncbi:hypothetical protein ACROYT_G031625 [Oculina patagonica]
MYARRNRDVHNKSLVYSGAETSNQPLTRRGDSKGEETCEMHVESPSRWGYAITMESEKIANYEQMKANYEQMKANYEQIHVKCEEIHEHVLVEQKQTSIECNTLNYDEHPNDGTDFADYKSSPALYVSETKCRMSRARFISSSSFHASKKREREPSRIPYRKFFKLFRKSRSVRNAAKSYLKKWIPSSSKLKLVLSECHRNYISERLARTKYSSSLRKHFVTQKLYLCIVQLRTSKHKKNPRFCMYVNKRMLIKLKHCQVQTYHVSHRVISLSGDIEQNPGPSYQCSANSNSAEHSASPVNPMSLLETRLSDLNRTALDVGGGGDCFFRAVSHQLYGDPNNHSYVCSLGVQYLLQNPEQFIESNTEHSWQGYLNNMSCEGTWADAIIVQAVANCLSLSIYIAESNETFAPFTVVQPINLTRGCRNIYIGHIGETHYVSTVEKSTSTCSSDFQNKTKCGQTLDANKLNDKTEKRKAYLNEYMKEYMKKRRANTEFRKRENKNAQQRYNNTETIRKEKTKAVTNRKMANIELVREIDKQSFNKRKAVNPEDVRAINNRSKRKKREANPECIREIEKQSFNKWKAMNPEDVRAINNRSQRKKEKQM